MKMHLTHNRGFTWAVQNNLAVKGYAFSADGIFMQGDGLAQFLIKALHDEKNMPGILGKLNGIYSMVFTGESNTYLYCDKSRFFPLFYRLTPVEGVSDEPQNLMVADDILNETACDEFRHTGFVTGSDTLIRGVFQVPAGVLVAISHELQVSQRHVFSYCVRHEELMNFHDPVVKMAEIIQRAAERLILSIGPATPVLPLSGGYDSRLIACLLKMHGYHNTICFTYGRNTREVEISQQVATLLGFQWHYVNYEDLPESPVRSDDAVFNSYYRFASRFTSMFYLQEFPALIYLCRHSLVPENSVFLPGHSGDLLGGSQFNKVFPVHLPHKRIIRLLIRKKFLYHPLTRKSAVVFHSRIKDELKMDNTFLGYSIFEDWDIREKIAKFIINSSQVFIFFNFQVRFFFWDDELMDFFRRLPPAFKKNKNLYNRCLKEKFFSPFGLNFDRELAPSAFELRLQRFKEFIKPVLPHAIQLRYMHKNDWACYAKLSRFMAKEIVESTGMKLPFRDFNSVLINWYLERVKADLKANPSGTGGNAES